MAFNLNTATIPELTLNRGKGSALYVQLAKELENFIASGTLKSGDRLPSERELAKQLGLSRTTVVNSYRELESRGFVRSHVGRGTFVCANSESTDAPFAWRGKVSATAELINSSWTVGDLIRDSSNPDVISFAGLLPALSCFPTDDYRRAMDKVIRSHAAHGLGVAPSEGEWRFRTQIARRFGAKPQQVLIVSGAQEGLDLIGRCLLDPGDAVIIDRPGYVGAIQNFRAAGARLIGWDIVRADLNELEDLILRYRPKLIWTNPTFQNPTGRSLSLKERQELLELTYRYRVPLAEDDPYRDTSLRGAAPPTLFQLDAANNTVIYIGTFSKTLAPGLRLGWVLASEYIVEQLASIKERQVLFTGGLNQMVLAEFLENGTYEDYLTRLKVEHTKRLNVMIRSLRQYFSAASLAINSPAGGLHVWCHLSGEVESRQLARHALSRRVVLANGEMFYPDNGAGVREFRLCFTSMSAVKIEEGVKSLSDAFIAAKSESSGVKRSRVSIV